MGQEGVVNLFPVPVVVLYSSSGILYNLYPTPFGFQREMFNSVNEE